MLHSAENPKGRGWASGSQNFFAKLKTSFLPRRSLGRTEKKSNKSPTVPLQKKTLVQPGIQTVGIASMQELQMSQTKSHDELIQVVFSKKVAQAFEFY